MRDVIVLSYNTELDSRSLFVSLAQGIIKGSSLMKQETVARNILTDELLASSLDLAAQDMSSRHEDYDATEIDEDGNEVAIIKVSRSLNILQQVKGLNPE